MFTGIVEAVGKIQKLSRSNGLTCLTIVGSKIVDSLTLGSSIAVDGVCLTVTSRAKGSITVEASKETLACSTLAGYRVATLVNLERPLTLEKPLGGHFVMGHVDGRGEIVSIRKSEGTIQLRIRVPQALRKYLVSKGSVTVDGISLTISRLHADGFSTVIIPHTLNETTIGGKKVGNQVNLEVDMLAKYLEAFHAI